MKDAELAFRTGTLFDSMITDVFWDSFKGELGRSQAEILVYLSGHGQAQASEIAEALNISKQHVSKNVAKFINDGSLEYSRSSADKRSNILSLSEKGKAYLESHISVSDEAFEQLTGKMEPDELADFREAMETIVSLLRKYSDK